MYEEEQPEEDVDEGCNLDVEMIEFIVGSFIKLFPEDKRASRRQFGHRLREDARGKWRVEVDTRAQSVIQLKQFGPARIIESD